MEKLPSISNLYDEGQIDKKTDELTYLLNQNPPIKWLKKNPYANNAIYIPIDRVEWLLKRIFKHYKIEVIEVKQIFNGVCCVVRLHYFHPITGEWSFYDGVGAAQIQTKKGSSPAAMENINNNAVQLCVPIAKTEAVKNAAKSFGRLFGSDLNRKSKAHYDDFLTFDENHPNWKKAVEALKSGKANIENIKSKYTLTEENEKKLKDETV